MRYELDRHPGWIVCRNLQEIPVPSVDVLPRWAERGRIRPDDYLVNPVLEECFQARELPELRAIFRTARMRPYESMFRALFGWAQTGLGAGS